MDYVKKLFSELDPDELEDLEALEDELYFESALQRGFHQATKSSDSIRAPSKKELVGNAAINGQVQVVLNTSLNFKNLLQTSQIIQSLLATFNSYLRTEKKRLQSREIERFDDEQKRLAVAAFRLERGIKELNELQTVELQYLLEEKLVDLKEADDQIQELTKTVERLTEATRNADSREGIEERLKSQEEKIYALRAQLKVKENQSQYSSSISIQDKSIAPQHTKETLYPSGMTKEQQLIENIRREIGIGLIASEEVRQCFHQVWSRLERALNKLADDIYSSSSSFAMELIQNADDNEYGDGVTPEVDISFFPHLVTFSCNEKGFNSDNVRALCNIGGSTKAGGGFIGRKGIGFKSVFKITNTPIILSNGFQFKFDVDEQLGYIVPQWLTSLDEIVPVQLRGTLSSQKTLFLLPLKKDCDFDAQELFNTIDYVLLFLRKIKELHVSIYNPTTSTTTSKFISVSTDRSQRLSLSVEISEKREENQPTHISTSKHEFIVERQIFNVPSDLLEDNRDSDTTEIVVAFPLDDTQFSNSYEEIAITEYPIYSYLPVRSFGFQFIIQADFLLVANRQDIHKNKTWNKWIRDQIPNLFYQAIQKNPILKDKLLSFLPNASLVTDIFWKPLVAQIRNLMAKEECIKTLSGSWCKVQDVLLLPAIEQCPIDNDHLKKALGKEFVHSSFVPLARSLNCKEFVLSDLIQCLHKLDELGILVTMEVGWFIQLFAWLSHHLTALPYHISNLIYLPLFPLHSSPEPTSLASGPIYSEIPIHIQSSQSLRWARVLDTRISTVGNIKQVLKLFGIRKASVLDIVEDILNFHSTLKVGEVISEDLEMTLEEQFSILHNNWKDCASVFNDLQQSFLLPTNEGLQLAHTTYFPSLKTRFRKQQNVIYLLNSFCGNESRVKHLKELGVQEIPRTIRKIGHYNSCLSPEFGRYWDFCVEGNLIELLTLLDQHWDVYTNCDEVKRKLKRLRNSQAPTTTTTSAPFDNTFIDNAELREIIGSVSVPLSICSIQISHNEIVDILDLKDINTKDGLNLLQSKLQSCSFQDGNLWERLYLFWKSTGNAPPKAIYSKSKEQIRSKRTVRETGDKRLAELLNLAILDADYSPDLCEFFAVQKTFKRSDYFSMLLKIMFEDDESRKKKKEKAFSNRARVKSFSELLEVIYQNIEAEVDPSNNEWAVRLMYLLEDWKFVGPKNLPNVIVAEESDEPIKKLFMGGRVKILHSFMTTPKLKQLVLSKGARRLSDVLQSKPEKPEGAKFSEQLTFQYRACLQHTLVISQRVLAEKEKERISCLATSLDVYIAPRIMKIIYALPVIFNDTSFLEKRFKFQEVYFDERQNVLIVNSPSFSYEALSEVLKLGSEYEDLKKVFPMKVIEAITLELSTNTKCIPRKITFQLVEPSSKETSTTSTTISSSRRDPSATIIPSPFSTSPNPQTQLPFIGSPNPQVQQPLIGSPNPQVQLPFISSPNPQAPMFESQTTRPNIVKSAFYGDYNTQREAALEFVEKYLSNFGHSGVIATNSEELCELEGATDELLESVGRFSELVIFHILQRRLPPGTFTAKNWVSTNRNCFYPEEESECDDTLGYDFWYEEDSKKVFAEVKGSWKQQSTIPETFHISRNEWAKAKSARETANSRYEIIKVTLPSTITWYKDPIHLEEIGILSREPTNWVVTISQPQPTISTPTQTLATVIESSVSKPSSSSAVKQQTTSRKLFIPKIPAKMTEEQLRQILSTKGIESVSVKLNKMKQAIVTVKSAQDLANAIKMSSFLLEGVTIKLSEYDKHRTKSNKSPTKK